MIYEINITILPEQEKNSSLITKLLLKESAKIEKSANEKNTSFTLQKRSIDARHGKVKFNLKYKAYIGEKPLFTEKSKVPQWKKVDCEKKVIIVGGGPAGLFGALKLLEYGIKPIIIERGEETAQRRKTIAKISTEGYVNENSNYCFGEGGAGTFSDGKLYTRSNKRGNIEQILQIFVHFGADEKILTDAHPHIGTEKLPKVINAMKDFICKMGGEFYFNTKCVDFEIENNKGGDASTSLSMTEDYDSMTEDCGSMTNNGGCMIKHGESMTEQSESITEDCGSITKDGAICIKGVKTQNTLTGDKKTFFGDAVLLASGHSANDIYELLAKTQKKSLEAKTFAIGVRVEHPREIIDNIQFHGKTKGMQAAEYRLTTQVEDRGVYSFCMCPGGFVVPSQTNDDEIVVNGMSASQRNSKWSNAAIVVETRVEDIPEKFKEEAKKDGAPALCALYYRKYLEQCAKNNSTGQKAPCQLMSDFISGKETKISDIPKSSYTPGLFPSRLDKWIPKEISSRLKQGFLNFNKKMHGYISPKALLIALETRTSTPVRIIRDKETFESPFIKNLFPAGEGSGYSGGIVSSAMDGENACQKIIDKIL